MPERETRVSCGLRLLHERAQCSGVIPTRDRLLQPGQRLHHRLGHGGIALEGGGEAHAHAVIGAVEVLILDVDRVDVGGDAAEVGRELRGEHGQCDAIVGTDGWAPRQALEDIEGLGIAPLGFRQRQERHVHQVVAVEIRIEDQVGGVAGVLDHQQDVLQQLVVGLVARVGHDTLLQGVPLPLHRCGVDLGPPAAGESRVRELEIVSVPLVDVPQREESLVDLDSASVHRLAARVVAGQQAAGSESVLWHVLQESCQRPLVGIAQLFELGKPDVLIDSTNDQRDQDDDRQRVGEADQRQAAGDRQAFEECGHGEGPEGKPVEPACI